MKIFEMFLSVTVEHPLITWTTICIIFIFIYLIIWSFLEHRSNLKMMKQDYEIIKMQDQLFRMIVKGAENLSDEKSKADVLVSVAENYLFIRMNLKTNKKQEIGDANESTTNTATTCGTTTSN